jgi:hypothetical protein
LIGEPNKLDSRKEGGSDVGGIGVALLFKAAARRPLALCSGLPNAAASPVPT